MTGYWLSRWIENSEIDTLDVARQRLSDPRAAEELIFGAVDDHTKKAILPLPEARHQLVASSGLNVSGALACTSTECIKKRVDQILYRSWHYFDNVLVTGLSPWSAIDTLKIDGPEAARDKILRHIDVLLYIRNIGAADVIRFSERPNYCLEHLQQHAHEAGILSDVEDVTERLGRLLEKEAAFLALKETPAGLKFALKFPSVEYVHTGTYVARPLPTSDVLAGIVSREAARDIVAQLIRDSAFARLNEASLGQAARLSDPLVTNAATGAPTSGDVAFNLSLPVIDRLPVAELLAVRHHEAADFQAFRKALQRAITERLSAISSGDTAESVADSVYEDIIEPALITLDRKVDHAAKIFAKKSVVAASVGTVATTVGLLAFPPITAAGLAVLVGGMLVNYNELLKERKEVELSDLYFLWRLTDKAAAHVS